jgi:phosphohistidine phosphatase SixA
MKEIAKALARITPDAEAIYSSPLVRARETAAWVAGAYGGRLAVTTTPVLAPDTDVDAFRRFLDDADVATAYFVGHEPTLSDIMLGLTELRGEVELKKSGCYGLRWNGRRAALEWMLTPRILRG